MIEFPDTPIPASHKIPFLVIPTVSLNMKRKKEKQ